MLTFLAWTMIIVFLALVMTKKLSPFTALIIVPLVFALVGSALGLYTEQIMELRNYTKESMVTL